MGDLGIVHMRNDEIKSLREKGETLESIGKKFGITKERVRQIVGNTGNWYTKKQLQATEKAVAPKNTICVSADGYMVFLESDTKKGYFVPIHDETLKRVVKNHFKFPEWW